MICTKKILKYVLLKWKFRKKCVFDFSSNIAVNSEFEGMNKLHSNVSFSGRLGLGSYIGSGCRLNAKIGRFCSIAPQVSCNGGIHPYKMPYVSTAPCFYSLNPKKTQNGGTFAQEQMFDECKYAEQNYTIVVGNDVWICEGAFINGGVRISDGAVVLAHSVVTKDVPPYAIVGGVPAKVIGFRYDDEKIAFLLKCKWWDNDIEWFKENWKLMSDLSLLQVYYEKNRG